MLYEGSFIGLGYATRESLSEFFFNTQKLKALILKLYAGDYNHVPVLLKKNGFPLQIFQIYTGESSRTRFDFKMAGMRMGASVTDTLSGDSDAGFSSMASSPYGIQEFMLYYRDAGGFIVRLGKNASVTMEELARFSKDTECARIISAGEVGRQPVQALTDLYTVFEYIKRTVDTVAYKFSGASLRYVVAGDIQSTAVSGFLLGVSILGAARVICAAPEGKKLSKAIALALERADIPVSYADSLVDAAPYGDVFYFTQLSSSVPYVEPSLREQAMYAEKFGVTAQFLAGMPQHAIAFHPWPFGLEFPLRIHREDSRFRHCDAHSNSVCTKGMLMLTVFNPDSAYRKKGSIFGLEI